MVIIVQARDDQPRRLTFSKPEVTVGRVEGNDIVLRKGNVSRKQCKFVLQDGFVWIQDTRSCGGTYVNAYKLSWPRVICAHDKVFIGDFTLQVEAPYDCEESVRDPNTPAPVLFTLAEAHPALFLENPVLPLLMLESPNFLRQLSPRARAALLGLPNVPAYLRRMVE